MKYISATIMSKIFSGTTLLRTQVSVFLSKTLRTFACFLASDSFLTWFGVFLGGFVCDDERLLLVLNLSSSSVWPRFFSKSGVVTRRIEIFILNEYLSSAAFRQFIYTCSQSYKNFFSLLIKNFSIFGCHFIINEFFFFIQQTQKLYLKIMKWGKKVLWDRLLDSSTNTGPLKIFGNNNVVKGSMVLNGKAHPTWSKLKTTYRICF